MHIGIVAGEASGDLLGAGLIKALRQLHPNLKITGVGGPKMIAEGCQSLFPIDELTVMGLIEPLFHLPRLFKIRKALFTHFSREKPDIFIGIDYPGFNLSLEGLLQNAGIKVAHYVSPSVWAWRKNRIYKIKKAVNLMLTLLPFEKNIYQEHQIPVSFVGHPLADEIPLHSDQLAARLTLHLDANKKYIAILPGSRSVEIKYLAETFVVTAQKIFNARPDIQFITSAINEKRAAEFQAICKSIAPHLPITFFQRRSHEVMAAADLILVSSGTATLEAMLFKKPMVIAYRLSTVTYQLARYLVKIPFMGLPNLLANELLVPEFFQQAATPENLSHALLDYLDHPEKVLELEKRFMLMHENLRQDSSRKAAEAVMSLISQF